MSRRQNRIQGNTLHAASCRNVTVYIYTQQNINCCFLNRIAHNRLQDVTMYLWGQLTMNQRIPALTVTCRVAHLLIIGENTVSYSILEYSIGYQNVCDWTEQLEQYTQQNQPTPTVNQVTGHCKVQGNTVYIHNRIYTVTLNRIPHSGLQNITM
jgi:hypothetical protein